MVVIYKEKKGINNNACGKQVSTVSVKKQLTTNNLNFLRSIGLKPIK